MHDEPTLVARAAAGSESAFRTLYRAHVRPVYWVAYGVLGDAGEAEDAAQETFVTAWRKLSGLQLRGASLLPWLVTICRFHCANRLRARRATEPLEHAERLPATVDVEKQVIDAEYARRILAEIEQLDPLDRDIFLLCATEGYGYDAAAGALGVTHGTVRNRLSRIRSRVRTSLGETS